MHERDDVDSRHGGVEVLKRGNCSQQKDRRRVPAKNGEAGQSRELLPSAENIQHLSEIDLGQLNNLPTARADLVALSIRMDAAFRSLCELVREAIAQDYKAPRVPC